MCVSVSIDIIIFDRNVSVIEVKLYANLKNNYFWNNKINFAAGLIYSTKHIFKLFRIISVL